MFNPVGEAQVAAGDGRRVVMFPRLSTLDLRHQVNDAHARGLTVLAVALYNCQIEYLHDWRRTLQNHHWLGCKLTMRRRRGEYGQTESALLVPAKEQVYTLAQFETLMLGGG